MINSVPVVGAPGWRLAEQDGYLVAVAGADEIWVIDDVPGTIVEELAACWTGRPPSPDQLSAPARHAVEQLRTIGVFGAVNTIPVRPRLAIRWAGSPLPTMINTITSLCRELDWPEPITESDPADLVIMIRTSATLAETAELSGRLTASGRIQLLCDLASARTIALGPLVVPGHTACIGCLTGRVASRWGDPQPPDRPRATEPAAAGTAAGLLMHHIRRATEGSFDLVDATVALDLDSLVSRRSPCLRSAQCAHCSHRVDDGRVELPWAR
jgi:bacteriocin biosynthesis cyclodehydratase domain-containing protein